LPFQAGCGKVLKTLLVYTPTRILRTIKEGQECGKKSKFEKSNMIGDSNLSSSNLLEGKSELIFGTQSGSFDKRGRGPIKLFGCKK